MRSKKRTLKASWGHPELDRLWQLAYEAESEINDSDLVPGNPKLIKAMQASNDFVKKLEELEGK
jgi:hypothetical protein